MADRDDSLLWVMLGGAVLILLAWRRKDVAAAGSAALRAGEAVMSRMFKLTGHLADPGVPGYPGPASWRPYVHDLEDLDIWNAVVPDPETIGVTNAEGERARHLYGFVIDQFDVEHNPRYRPGRVPPRADGPQTFCNIFVQDVMRAMGLIVPWSTANQLADWFSENRDGWFTVNGMSAQERANAGHPAVAWWRNPTGEHGHLAVVRPGAYASGGPTVANAGAVVFNAGTAAQGFGSALSFVRYSTHA